MIACGGRGLGIGCYSQCWTAQRPTTSCAAFLRIEEILRELSHSIIRALAPSLTPRSPHMSEMSHSDLIDVTSAVSVTLARCYVDPSTLLGTPFEPYNWRSGLLHKDLTEDEASDGHPCEFGSSPAAVFSRAMPLCREPATNCPQFLCRGTS